MYRIWLDGLSFLFAFLLFYSEGAPVDGHSNQLLIEVNVLQCQFSQPRKWPGRFYLSKLLLTALCCSKLTSDPDGWLQFDIYTQFTCKGAGSFPNCGQECNVPLFLPVSTLSYYAVLLVKTFVILFAPPLNKVEKLRPHDSE